MKPRLLLPFLALLVAFAFGAASCGGNDDNNSGAADTMTETGDSMAMISVESPAADLRVTLDRLLGEHAVLAAFAMQKGYAGEKDFKPLATALDANTVDLGDAIGSVYGPEARTAFLEQWRAHIGFFVDYTVALAKKDAAGQKLALGKLAGYRVSFGNFLAKATDGNLEAGGVSALLQQHVNQLVAALRTYSGGTYAQSYAQVREAYAHMFMTGDALAGAITAQKADMFGAGDATQGASDLRITLDRLLGEHALLAAFAMQKGYDGEKDFMPLAAALDGNTVDLGNAIGSVYGAEARTAFLKQWRAHIGFFVEYTVALAKKDAAGQMQALDKLNGYRASFANFLDTATGGELKSETVSGLLQQHVNQLVGALKSYAAGNFAQAYAQIREAYAHMYMTGDGLAGAIVKQKPGDFS